MPTYEYKCPECNHSKEVFHNMNHSYAIICEKCFSNMVRGFGGGSAIHFKGSGFYETDYKGK